MRRLVLSIVLCTLPTAPNLAAQAGERLLASDNETLAGLKGLHILIEGVRDVGVPELQEKAIDDAVELRLRRNKVPLVDDDVFSPPPRLYVNVNLIPLEQTSGLVFGVEVSVQQRVLLTEGLNKGAMVSATTWAKQSIGTAPKGDPLVREVLDQLLDSFALAYLRMNPMR